MPLGFKLGFALGKALLVEFGGQGMNLDNAYI
jgi:hypothetical protein